MVHKGFFPDTQRMPVSAPPHRGTFVEPIDDLIPRLALPAHQISATIQPRKRIRLLAQTLAETRQALERRINERLSEQSGN